MWKRRVAVRSPLKARRGASPPVRLWRREVGEICDLLLTIERRDGVALLSSALAGLTSQAIAAAVVSDAGR